MGKYNKKPVVIEAEQWQCADWPPHQPVIDKLGVRKWLPNVDCIGNLPCSECGEIKDFHGWINTLEGGHRVCPGDWIITGVKGERYPCKPDIFEQTYEEA